MFETLPTSGKDTTATRIAHPNPIAAHRIRHATGFLQTTLSKLPRQTAPPLPAPAWGSPDRVLTFITIYLLLAALYWNGWRQREPLDLTPLERVLTRGYLLDYLAIAAVGVIACLAAVLLPERISGYSGWVYILISPAETISGRITRLRVRRLTRDTPKHPDPA